MSTVKDPPDEGQVHVPLLTPLVPPMRWDDPKMVSLFFSRVRSLVLDAEAAAKDQLRPVRKRHLGHVETKRIVQESFAGLHEALAFAERDLPKITPD
jgi:hypothetical protein